MQTKYYSFLALAAVMLSGISISPALAGSSGNTVNNVDVFTNMGNGGNPTNRTRNSRSEIRNPSGANVHNDIQVGVSDTCGKSKNTNNVNHSGSTGANVSVNVDVCNPIYKNPATRRNSR